MWNGSEKSFRNLSRDAKKGLKQVADIQHNARLHPYFILMCTVTQEQSGSSLFTNYKIKADSKAMVTQAVQWEYPASMLLSYTATWSMDDKPIVFHFFWHS